MKRKTFAKVLNFKREPTDKLIDITDDLKDYIKIDDKNYHYAYDKGYYIEDDPDDDIPF